MCPHTAIGNARARNPCVLILLYVGAAADVRLTKPLPLITKPLPLLTEHVMRNTFVLILLYVGAAAADSVSIYVRLTKPLPLITKPLPLLY